MANANLTTKWVWQLPLTGFDQFMTFAPYFYDWIDHPNYDEYWAKLDVETRYDEVKVPALNELCLVRHLPGGVLPELRRDAERGRDEGGPEGDQDPRRPLRPRGRQRESHVRTGLDRRLLSAEAALRFFDRYLKGIENGYEDDPNVTLNVLVPPDTGKTGSGFTVTSDSYPLPGTWNLNLFLSSGGNANSSKGDGELVWEEVRQQGSRPDRYDYDPAKPVPTTGGNMCCNNVLPNGAQDQTEVELRNDVLVYTSAPLDQDLAVIGPVEVKLWAKTSARDTDFTAKLVDVHLDGASHNVLDRVVRARFRRGSKLPPSLIEPNEEYEYRLLLGNAGTMFRKGHRIRLEISSSNFPHYDRNLNTGAVNEWTAEMKVAHQTILHDRHHSSRLVLPIAPGVSIPH